MKIKINDKLLNVKSGSSVMDALKEAGINTETVLVKKKGKLIPNDEHLKNGDVLELINVISGG